MLISKENRRKIYEYFYQEGVLVAKKDYELAKHPEIDVPNLQVIKALQSLTSRGFSTDRLLYHVVFMAILLLHAHERRD